ncbi:hypothetical protein K439DRAFT_1634079 [Ramaria rubella]|nr:hypothetical protein K439DRAFT_1634079 [Ramaria rubella]
MRALRIRFNKFSVWIQCETFSDCTLFGSRKLYFCPCRHHHHYPVATKRRSGSKGLHPTPFLC